MQTRKTKIPPEFRLRAFVSTCYLIDAIDYLARTNIEFISEIKWNRSYRAKIFVDILHLCECSLKTQLLLVAPKEQTPEDVYKLIRHKGHDLYALAKQIHTFLDNRRGYLSESQFGYLKSASEFGANIRYQIDVISIASHSSGFQKILGPNRRVSSVSVRWLRRFHWIAMRLFDKAFAMNEMVMTQSKLTDEDRLLYRTMKSAFVNNINTKHRAHRLTSRSS